MSGDLMCSFQLTEFGESFEEKHSSLPVLAATEVLVKISGSGVCHSDIHLSEGYYDSGDGKKISIAGRVKLPITLGHEMTGEIVAYGSSVQGVACGDKVLVCPWIGCGQCAACAKGDEHLCGSPRNLGVYRDGGYANFVVVPDARYVIDIGDLDPVAAAPLACSGLTTYSAIKKFGPEFSESPPVIIGAGGLGLMSIGVLLMLGGKPPVVVELNEDRRGAAMDAGALVAIDPSAPDVESRIREAVGGPITNVLDLVGTSATARLGVELLDKGGRLIIVGLLGGELTVPVPLIPMKAITISGSLTGTVNELRELVDLIKNNGLPDIPIETRNLSSVWEAIEDLRNGKVVGRIVLVP